MLAMVVAAIMVVIMVEWLGVMATGLEWPGRASLFDGSGSGRGSLLDAGGFPVLPTPQQCHPSRKSSSFESKASLRLQGMEKTTLG